MAAEPVQLPTSGSLAGILDVLETDEDFRALISGEIEVPESDIDPSITVGVPEGLRPALAAGAAGTRPVVLVVASGREAEEMVEAIRSWYSGDPNDVAQLEEAFALHGPTIACVMIEPIAGNMNFVRASVPFMKRCRELCTEYGALLVLDEVMTGFRVALGSAQSVYAKSIPGFKPDITVLGKVIGGGMPLAAFGGPRAIMEHLAPLGGVYQAGTLSGNPVATACGLTTLREIKKPGFFDALSASTRSLVDGLAQAAKDEGVPFSADCEGGMFGFFLLPELPQNYPAVLKTDSARFNQLFHGLLDRGVYIAPALYEAGFVSGAHTADDIAATVAAAREVFKTLSK